MYNKKNILIASLIFLLTFITRYLFAEHAFYDADTVGYALGSISYSLELTRPHLPGYFLHENIIRLLNYITFSPHASILFLTFLYSSAGAVLTYFLFLKFFNDKSSLLAVLLIITNPLIWYFSSTTDIYIFDLFFSAAFVLLGISKKGIYFLPLFAAISMGIRPSGGVFLFPLYCYLWFIHYRKYGLYKKYFILIHIAGMAAFLLWFLPMACSAGSISAYFALYKNNSPVQNISILQNIFQFSSYLFWFSIPIILVIIYLAVNKRIIQTIKLIRDFYKYNVLFIYWLFPPMVVFLIYNYAKGWIILTAVSLLIWSALLHEKKVISTWFIASLIVLQSVIFIYFPKKENKIEEWFIPRYRNENLFTSWYNRTFSSYSMTFGKIKEQDQILRQFIGLFDSLGKRIEFRNRASVIDANYYSYARPLQYLYPDKNFITMDFDDPDSYIEYAGLNIQRKHGLRERVKNTVLISDNNFLSKYLNTENNLTIGHYFSFSIVPVDTLNRDKISSIYKDYFIRWQK